MSTARRNALIAGSVVAALLTVGLVAFLGARLGQPASAPPVASPTLSPAAPWSETIDKPKTVTQTAPPVTITRPAPPARSAPRPPSPPPRTQRPPAAPAGDLGLAQPMSSPSCNGQGIVVLGSVTTPGLYPAGVQRLLDAHPGAFYLRTDRTCPSLRAATAEGNPIYAVFKPAGNTQREVCAAVRAAGGDAYGKWLDYTTDPGYQIPC